MFYAWVIFDALPGPEVFVLKYSRIDANEAGRIIDTMEGCPVLLGFEDVMPPIDLVDSRPARIVEMP